MKKKSLLSEVRQLQKIAGILKENENNTASSIKWNYPNVDINSEEVYYEYNPESEDYTLSVPVYGTGPDSKSYKGLYTTDISSLEGEALDDLDLAPEKIHDVELVTLRESKVRRLQKKKRFLKENENDIPGGPEDDLDSEDKLDIVFDIINGEMRVNNISEKEFKNAAKYLEKYGTKLIQTGHSPEDIAEVIIKKVQGIKEASNLKENDQVQKVDAVVNDHNRALLAALKTRSRYPEDLDAHDDVKSELEAIASELGLDPNIPYMEDEMLSGAVPAEKAVEYVKKMFKDMFEGESSLEESSNFDPIRYVRNTLRPFEGQKLIDDVKKGGLLNYFTNLKSEDEVREFIRSFYI